MLTDPSSSTVQTDNTAGGDIVAGNKTVYYLPASSPSSRLSGLLAKLKADLDSNHEVQEIIEELRRFKEPHAKSPKDLKTKLTDCGRESLVDFATELKESFAMKLIKFDLFESAQEIHALVLAQIVYTFTSRVRPLLVDNAPVGSVEEAIERLIIAPIVNQLNEPPLRYNHLTVAGMLYFLTGNCHIDWS